MTSRQRTSEMMDSPAADERTLRRSLHFIERVNRRLGYTRALIRHIEAMIEDDCPNRSPTPVRILDIATGSADVPRAVLDWARGRHDLEVVGVDLHPITLQIAVELSHDYSPALQFMQADALALPFDADSFDYVITSMFLHHLDDDQIVKVLSSAKRIARRGVIAADLIRNRRALFWISAFTMFSNPMVKHDARASVRQALTLPEITEFARSAGLNDAQVHRHFGHRLVMSWRNSKQREAAKQRSRN
jgi:ubiquinone/menaquinone biosynthesis C-methylase UbiE